MISLLTKQRYGPIGVDIGSRSVKLVQFSADQSRLLDAARWDIPAVNSDKGPSDKAEKEDGEPDAAAMEQRAEQLAGALKQAREGRAFRGREAVLCLNRDDLFLQNIRVPKTDVAEMERLVQQEAAGRVPYPVTETEIRYIEAADVRQGDAMMREVILLACHRQTLQNNLNIIERAGLVPVGVEVEPMAMLRCYVKQYRRDEDSQQRVLFVHVGFSNTVVVIAQGEDVLFVKYIDVGGEQLDEAVARHLNMSPAEAVSLRRHNGDRRSEQQDPEISRSVAEAIRPVVERLANELSMCVRYHSVTFRGQPLVRMVLGGGEATTTLLESISKRLNLKCELGDPLRTYQTTSGAGRKGQWDVAVGLALRDVVP